jgi:hypothetical protein
MLVRPHVYVLVEFTVLSCHGQPNELFEKLLVLQQYPRGQDMNMARCSSCCESPSSPDSDTRLEPDPELDTVGAGLEIELAALRTLTARPQKFGLELMASLVEPPSVLVSQLAPNGHPEHSRGLSSPAMMAPRLRL